MPRPFWSVCASYPLKMGVLVDAREVLMTPDPWAKANRARRMRREWLSKKTIGSQPSQLPEQPARPSEPKLVAPANVPRRRLGSPQGRGALLHAVAHIELNAIDLAADMIARFSNHDQIDSKDVQDFISDWASVCDDEARHFVMLADRLDELGVSYGDYPAHNGLWEAAQTTCDNFPARIAIAPLVLEARGLDVTPGMIGKFKNVGDHVSADILATIYEEEIGHVAIGARWFKYLAKQQPLSPESYFHTLVKAHFRGRIISPFNTQARTLAGLSRTYYEPLAEN